MAAETDRFVVGDVERLGSTGVSAGLEPDGVPTRLERQLDRPMPFDRADTAAVDGNLEWAAPEFNAGAFALELECRRRSELLSLRVAVMGRVLQAALLGSASRSGDQSLAVEHRRNRPPSECVDGE
jgi:hypothetical protein